MDWLNESFCILREFVSQDFTSTLEPLALTTGCLFRETGHIPPLWHPNIWVLLLWV